MTIRIVGSSFATGPIEVLFLRMLHNFEVPFLLIGIFKYIADVFDTRLSGTIYLVGVMFIKQSAAIVLSTVAGHLYDTIGFHSAYLILGSITAAFTLLSAFLLTSTPRQKRRTPAHPSHSNGENMMQPNILVFFTDQQRWDTVGCYNPAISTTPVLDQLAREGVKFENAFTVQPVCGPARSCLQTGRYPTQNGCYRNNIAMRQDEVTLAKLFNQAGYDTAYIGKWHLADLDEKPVPEELRGGWQYWLAADALEHTSHPYGGHFLITITSRCISTATGWMTRPHLPLITCKIASGIIRSCYSSLTWSRTSRTIWRVLSPRMATPNASRPQRCRRI